MDFNFAEAGNFVNDIVKSSSGVTSGMTQLIDYCEANSPGSVWSKIRSLDFESDCKNLAIWLENVLSAEPPSQIINAFWFGLFNPILENGETSCGLYISGSTRFDEREEAAEWAVWREDTYLPEER